MAKPSFTTPISDLLRLEVETPTPAGVTLNLLENYIGDKQYNESDLGAYQWVTPYQHNYLEHDKRTTETANLWALVVQNQNASTPSCVAQTELLRVVGDQYVGASWLVPWSAASYRVRLDYYYASGSLSHSSSWSSLFTGSATTRRSLAPAYVLSNITHVRLTFEARTAANAAYTATGRVMSIRHVTVATGTQAATTSLPLITDSGSWTDALSSTHSIEFTREALDVGTLSATVLDSNLDPATASTIRPGRRLRLSTLSGGAWERLFVGNVHNPSTGYALRRTDNRRARIALSAMDRVNRLAGAVRPYAPQSFYFLPATVEGTGVPWLINGTDRDGKPGGASTTAIHRNDTATALDQITLTRDTELGYLWVNRRGVLEAQETLPATTTATLAEGDYSDLEVGFNLAKCFNQVTVKLQKYDATAQTSEELSYGPYVDGASIADWGPRPVTLTVAGNLSATNVANIAAQVLAQNAQPAITVSSLTLPILNNADLSTTEPRALLDLYDRVRVVNAANGVDVLLRIIRLTHRISQKRLGGVLVPTWNVDLDFEPEGSIATPTLQPGT